MTKRAKAYLGGPDGFAESTLYWHNKVLKPLVSEYVDVEDPWEVDIQHILDASDEDRPALWVDLGKRHLETIKNQDLFIGNFDGEPPDTGTVVEASWAAAHDIPVIGYRNDLRTCGEEGLPYNLMLAAVIEVSGGIAVGSLEELRTELQDWVE